MFPVLLVTEILTLYKINHPFETFNESVIIALFIKQKSNCYDNSVVICLKPITASKDLLQIS